MTFCNQCGQPLKAGQSFCTNCGNKLNEQASNVTGSNASNQKKNKKPVPKIAIISGLSAALLFFVLMGTYFVLDSIYKPEKVVTAFSEAVETEDYDSLEEILKVDKKDVSFTKSDLEGYVEYLTDEHDFENIKRELYKQVRRANNGNKTDPILDKYGNKILEIKEGKKALLLFDQYAIKAVPVTIEMAANFDDVEIMVNGKKAVTIKEAEESIKIGQFLPGTYEIEAKYKGEYAELEETLSLSPRNGYDNVIEGYVSLKGRFVSVYSNIDDAILYVNGKSTGEKVSDLSEFGPVKMDGSITLHAESGDQKSKEVKLRHGSNIYLEFESEEDLDQYMYDYLFASVQAINQRNFELVEFFLDPEGNAYNELKEYIDYLEEEGITEELINVTVKEYEKTEDGYLVTTHDEYIIFNKDGTEKEVTFKSVYDLRWSDDKLMVYSLESTEEM